MKILRYTPLIVAFGLPFGVVGAQAQSAPSPLPLKYKAQATSAAITPGDLMSRLYQFADDSMMGRQIGTRYNDKGTQYIADELKKLGLRPAGDNGTYFQNVHAYMRAIDSTSTITVEGRTFRIGTDFLVSISNTAPTLTSTQVYYVGNNLDTLHLPSLDAVRGKWLLFGPYSPDIQIETLEQQQKFVASHGYQEWLKMAESAAGTVAVEQAFVPAQASGVYHPLNTANYVHLLGDEPGTYGVAIVPSMIEAMFGSSFADLKPGTLGKTLELNIKYTDTEVPGRNVVGILPGSDPKLRGEYVAIGAHNDHIGFCSRAPNPERACSRAPVDHDSLRAFLGVAQKGGVETPVAPGSVTPEMWARINAIKDSLRALHGGTIRMDSINNGADDDGTGSMGVLEIAQAFAMAKVKPKRSLIFVWHVGEEKGMYGSNYFTDHPTVPRDSIVAQLNVDMIGRGSPDDDVPWGGPSYLQLIGSRRLSTELGDIVEAVNKDTNAGFRYDYQFDANGDPHNYYCRSDHWAYARYGIPITFFTTGGHRDYHQVTDEPQYIDYTHYATVAQLIHDIGLRVANLDHRPLVDKQKGDPYGSCQQ